MLPSPKSTSTSKRRFRIFFQYFELHFAHYADVYLAELFVPVNVQLRVFIFQQAEVGEQGVRVDILPAARRGR